MNNSFNDITNEDIKKILLNGVDNGNWHTPSVGNVTIISRNPKAIYGAFHSSLHNQYWDRQVRFNINSNGLKMWLDESTESRSITKPLHVYCQPQIVTILLRYELVNINQEA